MSSRLLRKIAHAFPLEVDRHLAQYSGNTMPLSEIVNLNVKVASEEWAMWDILDVIASTL